MANRDHSLDDRIVRAAREEFLEHGFQKASLHKIADRAGITTGALYTRYKNKDDLFCSLVREAFAEIGGSEQPLRQEYEAAQRSGDVEQLLAALREEERVYLELMFRHYEECILFFCRSDGSSIQTVLEKMMADKARDTIAYLKSLSKKPVELRGIDLILCEQFRYYRLVLERGYSKEEAMACLATVERFMEAGWKDLFERLL